MIMIHQNTPDLDREGVAVLFRIISRHNWAELQSWHKSCPGSTVEHLMYGLFVLTIPPGGAGEATA